MDDLLLDDVLDIVEDEAVEDLAVAAEDILYEPNDHIDDIADITDEDIDNCDYDPEEESIYYTDDIIDYDTSDEESDDEDDDSDDDEDDEDDD